MNNFPSYDTIQASCTFVPLPKHPDQDHDYDATVLSETEGDYGLNCPDYIWVNSPDHYGILIPKGAEPSFTKLIDMYNKNVREFGKDEE